MFNQAYNQAYNENYNKNGKTCPITTFAPQVTRRAVECLIHQL